MRRFLSDYLLFDHETTEAMMRRASALFLAGGWIGYLFGLAQLLCAWRYRHEGELGLSVDFTARGAVACGTMFLILLGGAILRGLFDGPLKSSPARDIHRPVKYPSQVRTLLHTNLSA